MKVYILTVSLPEIEIIGVYKTNIKAERYKRRYINKHHLKRYTEYFNIEEKIIK